MRRTKIREQGEAAKKTDMASEKMISDKALKDTVSDFKLYLYFVQHWNEGYKLYHIIIVYKYLTVVLGQN